MSNLPLTFMKPVQDRAHFYRWASALALVTIVYNILEGCISVFFGLQDDTIALFGFGLDSFVEVISGVGIWHMVRRMRESDGGNHDQFEKRALQVTGGAFYLLAAGLAVTSALNIYRGSRPETTFWGMVVSAISILSMWILIHYKMKIGRQYHSQALIADANCSRTCMYLSVILFASSLGYAATGIGMLDSAGAIGIAIFSIREGKEAIDKSKGKMTCSCQGECGG